MMQTHLTHVRVWIWFHLKVLRNLETFAEVRKLSYSLKVLAKVEELKWHVVTEIGECY